MRTSAKFICALVILLIVPNFVRAEAEKTDLSLSLEQCIVRAVERNLGVAVEILNPELADWSLRLATEQYLPQLSFEYGKRSTISPSFSWIDAEGNVTSQFINYEASLSQLMPTGGTLSVSMYSYMSETNQRFQTINPRYGSQLTFTLNQPLLRNFGYEAASRQIIIARNNRDMSEEQFKVMLQQTVYSVEEAYWNLVYSLDSLSALRRSLELAKNLLAKNTREVEVGTLAPIEILAAESEVATREADILQAELELQNNEDALMTLINLNEEEKRTRSIIPLDRPKYDVVEVSLERALRVAMDSRPDLKRLRLNIKGRELDMRYAKNQLLPDLDLNAQYWSPGISGTQILYLDNNPLTDIIIGTIEAGAIDALKDALNFKYRNWSVNLTLTIPINSIFTRSQFGHARVNLDQAKLMLQDQEQQVFLEIRNAVRSVQINYKRVQAYRAARELAERSLQAEEKRLQVGLTTNYTVLQFQRDLANARRAEIRSIIDYNLSMAALERAMGTNLKNKSIEVARSLN